MAQSYTDPSGQVLYIPGGYASYTVQTDISGVGTSGVIAIIGEADQGPSFDQETDLKNTFLGPNSLGAVVAKYGGGRLVDAYRNMVSPSDDPEILGAPTRFYFLKTNAGSRASYALLNGSAAAYGTLYSRNYGAQGNLVYFNIDSNDEIGPTTGSFTYIPAVGTVNATFRANGGSAGSLALSANTTPTAFVTAVDGISGIDAAGGVNRNAIAVSGTLALVATGNLVTITRSVAWAVTPTVGDTLVIPTGSILAGGANANVGAYVITSVTSTEIGATKLSDAGKGGATPGVITAPANVVAASIVAVTDIVAYSPVTISLPTTLLDGVGKSLEINQLATGTDLLDRTAYVLATTTPVTWISKTGSPKQIISATERSVIITVARQTDGSNESATAGGQIALKVGYTGTTATLQITSTQAIFTVTGGSGASFTVDLASYPTIADLTAYIDAQVGFDVSAGNASLGQQPATVLDEGTYGICTTYGNLTGRVKMDAVKFLQAVNNNLGLIQFGLTGTPAASGLPADYSNTFLAGGALGATTNANFQAALDACKKLSLNFVVPLMSQDASADIILGETSSSSTYTIDFINAATKTHVINMSKLKAQKNRQGFCSFLGTFDEGKDMSGSLAEARISLCIQDMKDLSATSVEQFQPWMSAAKAAALQAAAFYKSIFNKLVNCSGVLMADGTFDPSDQDQVEDALQSGFLVLQTDDQGAVTFISDQTTWQRDDNFVWNSIQAIYDADTVSLTTAKKMSQYFVGKSLADFTAESGLQALGSIMGEMLRLKLLAPSDDAPLGYKDAVIRINGNTMYASVGIKLATSLYFFRIEFVVSRVQQSASQ